MLKETERLYETNPNHVPVLIQLDSSILKIDKQKFLISHDINFNDFVNNTLKKKLMNLYNNDVLEINVVRFTGPNNLIQLKSHPKHMKDVYNEYKDIETNLLILRVSRNTTYKYLKTSFAYWIGY